MSDWLNKLHEGGTLRPDCFLSAPFNLSRFNHLTPAAIAARQVRVCPAGVH